MKNNKWSILLIMIFFLLAASYPMYCMAKEVKGAGNISGLEERILLMKQDFLYLDGEIQRLRGECN